MNEAVPKASIVAQTARPPSRAAFAFIFVTVLLDMMAIGIVIPVLPGLIVGFMGGDAAGALLREDRRTEAIRRVGRSCRRAEQPQLVCVGETSVDAAG